MRNILIITLLAAGIIPQANALPSPTDDTGPVPIPAPARPHPDAHTDANARPVTDAAEADTDLPRPLPRPGSAEAANPPAAAELAKSSGTGPQDAKAQASGTKSVAVLAFAAADRGAWDRARSAAAESGDRMVEKLILWRSLVDGKTLPPFDLADRFLKENPDWPLRQTLLERTEAAEDPSTPPAEIIRWYAGREPASVTGLIRLGEAERASGLAEAGAAHLRQAWVRGSFSETEEKALQARDGDAFTADTQRQRLDRLLWHNDYAAARRQISRVDAETRQIAEARIAVQKGQSNAVALIAALPPPLASDPMLTLVRVAALRRSGHQEEANALIKDMPTREIAQTYPWDLWVELAAAARQALSDGDADTAYHLVANPGFPADDVAQNHVVYGHGTEYADAQFLAGWIALRKLNQPQLALGHFKHLTREVSRPISAARGLYWQGRVYEALGDPVGAWGAYKLAADYPETFYGQLALARSEAAPTLALHDAQERPQTQRDFDTDEQMRAMRTLLAYHQTSALRSFAMHYQHLYPDAEHTHRMLALVDQAGSPPMTVRLAKQASYRGLMFLTYAFPTIQVPHYRGPETPPEPALVHALIRQETEFAADAVSPTDARGLMQVMAAGAKEYARRVHLTYNQARLTQDADYNMQLGMAMIVDYFGKWDGSLILGTAAYNAGPTNARRWIAAFGDPRQPDVDPVDWIEQIPFGETRNYVQRVLENLQIYRTRLAGGKPQPLRILDDLYGSRPHPKPILYRPPQSKSQNKK